MDSSCVELFQRRIFYWREIFKHALEDNWTPGKSLLTLHNTAQKDGLKIVEPTTTEDDDTQSPAKRPRLDPDLADLEIYL